MRSTYFTVKAALVVLCAAAWSSSAAAQSTWYVNGSCGDDSWSGRSPVCEAPDGPKATIQSGVDAALDLDVILIADGTYTGAGNTDVAITDRALTLRAQGSAETCIIDAAGAARGLIISGGGPVIIEGVTIRNGRSLSAGGGVFMTDSEVELIGCVVESCAVPGRGVGGGLCAERSDVRLVACRFADNSTEGAGGGAAIQMESSLTMSNCEVLGNRSTSGGGLLFVLESGHSNRTAIIEDSRFIGNQALPQGFGGGGGGVRIAGAYSIRRCEFAENTGYEGAGMFLGYANPDGPAEVIDCEIRRNRASGPGGGAFVYPTSGMNVRFIRTTFESNTSRFSGGGLYSSEHNHTLLFDQVLFLDNVSEEASGGGVALVGGAPATIQSCLIEGNTAAGFHGGGLFSGSLDLTLRDTVVRNNDAAMLGGGLWAGHHTIVQSLIAGNRAGQEGGGIYLPIVQSGRSAFINSTVVGNVARRRGGGIVVAETESNFNGWMRNSIIWHNQPRALAAPADLSVHRSNVELGWSGVGNLDADPRFVDPVNGDYRLAAGSPCIDAGDNEGVDLTLDLSGQPRFHDDPGMPDAGLGSGAIIDMGAYEFQGRTTEFVTVHPRPGLAGQVNTLQAAGASPTTRVYFVDGLQHGSTQVPGCPGLRIEIAGARVAASAITDLNGYAAVEQHVPAAAQRVRILLQVVEPSTCRVTSLVQYRFP